MSIVRARTTHGRSPHKGTVPKTYSHGGNTTESDVEYAARQAAERIETFLREEATRPGNDPTSVYVYYAPDGECLYVGITSAGVARSIAHAGESAWFQLADRCELEHYPNRKAALRREAYLITAMQPTHNRYHPRLFKDEPELAELYGILLDLPYPVTCFPW